ncbi:MAG: asparagine--tRNA ligase, partial [Saprospiraceae bacterium]|nr:asparagine--tRNA ligase [Saprospiraceae bacterium]
MSERLKIKRILEDGRTAYQANVKGWVRTFRNNQFIALNDGSTIKTLQVVIDKDNTDESTLKEITTGAAISATGEIIPSQGAGQTLELKAHTVEVLGLADPEKYPLQPKKHSLEFLREIAHLRFRTNTFGSIFRIRHSLAFAIHQFFNDNGFVYLHTPIVTGSDAEGAGEMFQVTTLPLDNIPKDENNEVDFSKDFFNKPTNLTVSGQLEAELGALA